MPVQALEEVVALLIQFHALLDGNPLVLRHQLLHGTPAQIWQLHGQTQIAVPHLRKIFQLGVDGRLQLRRLSRPVNDPLKVAQMLRAVSVLVLLAERALTVDGERATTLPLERLRDECVRVGVRETSRNFSTALSRAKDGLTVSTNGRKGSQASLDTVTAGDVEILSPGAIRRCRQSASDFSRYL